MDINNTVGVVIPTYNRTDLVVRAVNSVLNQTRPVDIVVVVDDGSPSTVTSFLDQHLQNDRVVLIKASRHNHPGVIRQIGVDSLDTTWVAFLDSDDYWDSTKVEKQLAYAKRNSAQAVSSNAIKLKDNQPAGHYLSERSHIYSLSKLIKRNVIINSTVLINRNLLKRAGGLATSWAVRGCEDYATWLRVSTFSNWHYIDESLCYYTDEPSDSIRTDGKNVMRFSNIVAICDFVSWQLNTGKSRALRFRVIARILPWLIQ